MRNCLLRHLVPSRARVGASCVALAVVAMTLLGGCRDGTDDVATLAGDSPVPDAGRLASARAMADCLEDSGIPTNVVEEKDQPVFIVPAPDEDTMYAYPSVRDGDYASDGGSGGYAASAPDWLIQQWERMRVGYGSDQAMLFVAREDRSADFGQCLEATGYVPPGKGGS